MRRIAGLILAGAVAAILSCAPMAQPAPDDTAAAAEPAAQGQDACGASRYGNLIGRNIDRMDPAALPPQRRVVCFGCMVTMEYVAGRVTIQLDGDRKVASMRCG